MSKWQALLGLKDRKHRRSVSLRQRIFVGRLTLLWERAWPVLLATLAPALIFITLTLCGFWLIVPAMVHWASIVALVIGTASANLWSRERVGQLWPPRSTVLARMERDSGIKHDALQILTDRPFDFSQNTHHKNKAASTASGQSQNTLWQAHFADMAGAGEQAKVELTSDVADAIDPFGLRFGTISLLAFGFVVANNDVAERLASAFLPTNPSLRAAGVADVWLEPPTYTGRPPLYLLNVTEEVDGLRGTQTIPSGTRLVSRFHTRPTLRLTYRTADGDTFIAENNTDDPNEYTLVLSEPGVVTLRSAGVKGEWPIDVTPDAPPGIKRLTQPALSTETGFTFSAYFEDDYGIATGNLHLKLDPKQTRPVDAPTPGAVAQSETRIITLDGAAGPSGQRLFSLDLSEDPWAGLKVIGHLQITDGAGQIATSIPFVFTLPKRRFVNPLARSVIEQRQRLALQPKEWRKAEMAFSGLTLAPQFFFEDASDYLLLRNALWTLRGRGQSLASAEVAHDVVSALWPLALQLEDKRFEDARARLEAARDALRAALSEGASSKEIERLTEALRRAMQQYLAAAAQSPTRDQQPANGQEQNLDLEDLNSLVDSIKDLAANGAQSAAERALSELESILENLNFAGASGAQGTSGQGTGGQQSAQQGGQPSGRSSQSGQAGGAGAPASGSPAEAADLIRRQRELSDRTYTLSENPYEDGSSGVGRTASETIKSLTDEQSALNTALQDVLSALGQNSENVGSGGENGQSTDSTITKNLESASRALRDAQREMQSAENSLKAGALEAARTAMDSAVTSLREGAGQLSDAAQAALEAQAGNQNSENGDGTRRDPLGRAVGGAIAGDGVDVPGIGDAERARIILEELWRRLSTGERTEEEIEYLERLLERF
ncbi:MAG: DUF4175 family protein [Pseudomonadota bacterium]